MQHYSEAEAVLGAIRNRRNVPYTKVKEDRLQADHLHQILEAANWAPSHKHTEPWRFYVFEGAGRAKIAALLSQTYRDTAGNKFMERKYQKARTRPLSVGAVIAVVMRPSRKPVLPDFEEILAMGGAVQNLQLAAHVLGIGVSWSTPGYLNHGSFRDFFALEEPDRCFGLLYLGYMDDETRLESKRCPVEDKITRIES